MLLSSERFSSAIITVSIKKCVKLPTIIFPLLFFLLLLIPNIKNLLPDIIFGEPAINFACYYFLLLIPAIIFPDIILPPKFIFREPNIKIPDIIFPEIMSFPKLIFWDS